MASSINSSTILHHSSGHNRATINWFGHMARKQYYSSVAVCIRLLVVNKLLPITGKGGSIAIHQVDNVPVIETWVDRWIVWKKSIQSCCRRPWLGATQPSHGPVVTVLSAIAPTPTAKVKDPGIRVRSTLRSCSNVVAWRTPIKTDCSLVEILW